MSEIRRLPRIGKIRLGIKGKTTGGVEYPKEVSYFVCPPEVQAVYGATPTSIDVMFPVEDETFFFPQNYKWYAASHLKCKGDGQTAMRRVADLTPEQVENMGEAIPKDPNALVEVDCPCPLLQSVGNKRALCTQHGNLMVILPRVSMGGVYQIDTGSFHNMVRINSAIDYTRGLVGRVALVPLILRRMPETTEYQGKRATHYLLSLEFKGNIDAINRMRHDTNMVIENVQRLALPAPGEIAEAHPEPPQAHTDAPQGPFPTDATITDAPPAQSAFPEDAPPPPAPAVQDGQAPVEIAVAKVEKTKDGYRIITPAKVVYFTDKVDVANGALKAKQSGKPIHAFIGFEDGVMFILSLIKPKKEIQP